MDVRAHLLGTERGTALAVVVTFMAVTAAVLFEPPIDPPFDRASVGYWALVLLYTTPAILASGYGAGLLEAWVTEGVPAAALWWFGTAAAAPSLVVPLAGDRALAALQVGLAAGVVLGTVGFALGRLADAAWARRPRTPAESRA